MNILNKKIFISILGLVVILLAANIIYLTFFNSTIVTRRGSRNLISISDLKNGIRCDTLMSSSIENGWNTDDQSYLFGSIEEYDTGELTSPLIKLTNEGKTLQQEYSTDNIKEFDVVKQNDYSVHAIFEGVVNPYTEYFLLDLDIGEFRHTRTSFHEGNGLSISRGSCYKNE